MKTISTSHIFRHLFLDKKLPPATIFSLPYSQQSCSHLLEQWIQHLLQDVLTSFFEQESHHTSLSSHFFQWDQHPDLLFLSPLTNSQSYQLEQWQELHSFLQQDPFSLPYKIIIIQKIHLMPDVFFHKMLKIMEDPPIPLSFFLLHAPQHALLSTIRSRCVNWRLTTKDLSSYPLSFSVEDTSTTQHLLPLWSQALDDLLSFPKSSVRKKFLQFLKESPLHEDDLLTVVTHWVSHHPTMTYLQKDQFLQKTKWFFQSRQHHLPVQERWIQLLLSLKEASL
jgi:hypothetical protein